MKPISERLAPVVGWGSLSCAQCDASDHALGEDDIQQHSGQNHDRDAGKKGSPVASVLHGGLESVQTQGNRALLLGGHKDEGEHVLIPKTDEVKDRGGEYAWRGERQHDRKEDAEWTGAIQGGGFLDLNGERSEESREKENREWDG